MDLIKRAETQNTLFNKLTSKNLERMRNQSKFGKFDSEKDMEKVARDFEAVFVNKLFESMRKGVPKSSLLDSSAMQMYQSLMDQEMSKQMSERKGMGLGEMVYKDLNSLDKVSRGDTISSLPLEISIDPNGIKTQGE
jgi:Rod binding domain-containing protein